MPFTTSEAECGMASVYGLEQLLIMGRTLIEKPGR